MSSSPRLAWELLERIICFSGGDAETLYSFSLSCSQLRPRSLCLMVANVVIMERKQVAAFRDFVEAYPHLRPFVRSITTQPATFMPFPLLAILPNLTAIIWTTPWPGSPSTVSLPQPVLTSLRRFGTNVTTLDLWKLSFKTLPEFCRMLLAFTSVKRLLCQSLSIRGKVSNNASLELFTQRLSQQLSLRSITMDVGHRTDEAMARLLFNSAHSTVEILSLLFEEDASDRASRIGACLRGLSWPVLRSLTLRLPSDEPIGNTLYVEISNEILKELHPPRLVKVTVYFPPAVGRLLRSMARPKGDHRLCSELDRTLLRSPHSTLVFGSSGRCRRSRKNLWTQELGKHFPKMAERGSLIVASRQSTALGHDDRVYSIVYSPDSKWLATASRDSTVIIWDSLGNLAQQWVAHDGAVRSLAFSPDSRWLASAGEDRKLAVWDVTQGACGIAVLEGHTGEVTSCAWSSDGTLIASGSYDGTVRLWDARTFDQLYSPEPSTPAQAVLDIRFSLDGRWLVSRCSVQCFIRDTMTGKKHEVHWEGEAGKCLTITLNPQSTRLVTGHQSGLVKIWDVRTGELLFRSRQYTRPVVNVAFSSDGMLALSVSGDGTAKIWDTSSGVMHTLSLHRHTLAANVACFSPCGKYVASASSEQTVRVRRVDDVSHDGTLCEHKYSVMFMAFSPDGKILSFGTSGGAVFIRRMHDIIPVEDTNM
ncbi:WD40-repeat-containing domain protein [Dichomitus squalens]|uniref:WD40-repeat-containing domain protein n=1 Tax=Dichomitus squalens TaxID=114155 RepID=A0A4Q9PJZ9_9APHY|nr:WD40-repeat-containing domain protein [Dichomitus squalens]